MLKRVFLNLYFYQSLLFIAVENNNIEIVKLLLSNDKTDINFTNVNIQYFNTIHIKFFLNSIQIVFQMKFLI